MNNKYKTNFTMKISFLLLLSGVVCFSSCTKKFEDQNTDGTRISSVSKSEYPFMFAYALMAPTLSPDNFEVGEGTIAGIYSQFYSQAAHSFPTDRYVMVQAWNPSMWTPVYTQAVPQLKTIIDGSDAGSAEAAIANIWWVWCFHRITDHFGPIPYTQAGNGQRTVAYTPQDSVYFDFFKRLNDATAALQSRTGEKPFGTYDLVYGKKANPVGAWIKFANTLRLRLAMRISKVNPALAKTEAEAAVAGGLLTALDDDAYMPKTTSYYNEYNGLAVTAGWDDIRMSATMESLLKGYNDPRMQVYFQPAVATGTYEGVRNGLFTSEKIIDINSRLGNSNLGTRWCTWVNGDWKTNYGVPQDIMHCAEAYFLKAEGALNGWNMGGNAKDLYETGIRMSMNQWGITDGTAIDAYIASSAVPVAPEDGQNSPAVNDYPIKWSADPAMQYKQVSQQKWLALFPDGMEGWAEVRRTDLPGQYTVVHTENSDLPEGTFIKRIPFLDIEKLTNGDAVNGAVQMLGGPDNVATKLWWDTN